MKHLILLATVIGSAAYAQSDMREEAIQNTVVKSTYALMQAKHANGCEALTVASVSPRCLGAIPTVTKLTLERTGCAVSVSIKCPDESAEIFGTTRSVYALDGSGMRNDVKTVDFGLSFDSITISPTQNP